MCPLFIRQIFLVRLVDLHEWLQLWMSFSCVFCCHFGSASCLMSVPVCVRTWGNWMTTRLLRGSTAPKVTWDMGFDDRMWQVWARRAKIVMPTARLRAQCTDFKTSLGPLQKHWELLLLLCGHPGCSTAVWLELHLQVMQCSPWWPVTAFTVSQDQKWFHCFPLPLPVDIGFSSCSYQAKPMSPKTHPGITHWRR